MSDARSNGASGYHRSPAALLLQSLEDQARPPSLSTLAAAAGPLSMDELLLVLRVDQRRRLTTGLRIEVVDYLARFPQLATDAESLFELIYSEWLIREEIGEHPTVDEYAELFPTFADRLRLQLEVHDSLGFTPLDTRLPGDDDAFSTGRSIAFDDETSLPEIEGYDVVGELGRGGMGIVYRARQQAPRREVALKMILAGVLASNQERIRFQNEAESVAALDHPNIVPILELGRHRGLLYFTMRLIAGGSLADQLDRFRNDFRAIANLMLEVTSAVKHAHERGLLHRDLKPANILLDDAGRPYVTDFGLAKRTHADPGHTRTGWFIGSPGYMAPEQASGKPSSITTATDIYGLGSILYSMLTGRPPFEGPSVQDTINLLRDRPPEPPSRFNSRTPKPLEIICLKCLEKDPARRYSTTEAFATDLKRWLAGLPINAKSVGPWERARLWIRRSPTQAALCFALALALLGGIVTSGALWYRAEANLRIAEASARNERDAKMRALARFNLALRAIKDIYSRESINNLQSEHDLEGARRNLYRQAGAYYKKLRSSLSDDPTPEAREQLAWACFELGVVTFEYDLKGAREEATAAFDTAAAVLRELCEEAPNDAERALTLAHFHYERGRCELTRELYDEAIDSLDIARSMFEKLANRPEVRERALVDLSWSLGNIAAIEVGRKRFDVALRLHEQVREIRSQLLVQYPNKLTHKLDSAWVLMDLAIVHNGERRIDIALELARKSSDDLEKYARENPRNRDALSRCAEAMTYRAACEGNSGHTSEMIRTSNRAIELAEQLVVLDGNEPRHVEALANLYADHANRLVKLKDPTAARPLLARSIELLEKVVEQQPTNHHAQTWLAIHYTSQYNLALSNKEFVKAQPLIDRAIDLRKEVYLSTPYKESNLALLLSLDVRRGLLQEKIGDFTKARETVARVGLQLPSLTQSHADIRYNLGCLLSRLSGATGRSDDAECAMVELKKAAEGGFRNPKSYRNDPDLVPLAGRRDFQELLLDLSFPDDPFTR